MFLASLSTSGVALMSAWIVSMRLRLMEPIPEIALYLFVSHTTPWWQYRFVKVGNETSGLGGHFDLMYHCSVITSIVPMSCCASLR